MVTELKIQNVCMASMEELAPARKAKQSVREVIVIDGPACLIAY